MDFKEALKEKQVDKKLFDAFNAILEEQGIITYKGSLVEATFVTVPVRHTTKKDDERFKTGEKSVDLDAKCSERLEKGEIKSKDSVVSQTGKDACWTKKGEALFWV